MKCDNCGSNSNFEWATFCRQCNQPLTAHSVVTDDQGTKKNDIRETVEPEPVDQLLISDAHEKIETGGPEPLECIMGSYQANKNQSAEQAQPGTGAINIEKELTLYKDNEIRMTLNESSDPPQVSIESLKSGVKVAANATDSVEISPDYVTQPPEDIQESESHQVEAQATTRPVETVPPESHQQEVTRKVEESPAAANEHQAIIDEVPRFLDDVKSSKGVIHLCGKDLKLTGGMKVEIGDELTFKDKVYQVKALKKNNTPLLAGIGAGAALVLFLALMLFTGFWGSDIGQLAGVVTSGIDGRPLPGLTVRLAENNKTAKTNEAGFFVFEHLPAGMYTIESRTIDGNAIQDRISVLKGQTSTIALREIIHHPETPYRASATQSETEKSPYMAPASTTGSGRGYLKISLTPNNSSVYLDGKPLGVGSNTYRVAAGSHELVVRKNGYQDETRSIKIEDDKTHSFNISLRESVQSSTPGRPPVESAQEKERAGNYQEAFRKYDQTLKRNPGDISAILGKARCARALGRLDDASNYYLQAARMASDKRDYKSQIEALTGVIEIKPNTFTAYSSRGDILYDTGQYERAINDFSKVIELDKRNLAAYYKLGNSYYRLAKYSDALGAYLAAEELNFADAKAQAYLAKTYLALGDKRNTRKSFERFKELASYSIQLEFKKDPDWKKVLAFMGETE
jgi:Flp pilus assembly protein TadD